MTTPSLRGEELAALQNEKGQICVSIVIPTHRLSPERRTDKPELKNAIELAGQMLRSGYDEKKTAPLLGVLNEFYKSTDFTHNQEGIGIYVSPNVKFMVQYPFPVEEKVMVGDNFEIRDLLYKINYGHPYFVLLLTGKGGRLFEGTWNNLTEVKDNNFPVKYPDDYDYSKPAHSSSYAGYSHVKIFEKDKSELEAIRFRDFFRKADKLLGKYLIGNTSFVLLGVEKDLSLFCRASSHTTHIAGKIAGNYNHDNDSVLGNIAWPVMRLYWENEWKNLVKEFEEKTGQGLGVTGIQDIWYAVQEGNGLKLLVEKDFRSPGFLTDNDYHLYLRPPVKPHRVLPDAVDEIIETVLEKNGQVVFLEKGMLKDHQRMALITRY